MKKLLPLFCLFLLSAPGIKAQDVLEVPEPARQSFYKDYPWAKKATWSLKSANVYAVDFTIFGDKQHYRAKYDNLGNQLEKQSQTDYSLVPEKAKREMEKQFPGYTPAISMWFEALSKKSGFKVVLEKWTPGHIFRQTYKVTISASGELLKTDELQLEMADMN